MRRPSVVMKSSSVIQLTKMPTIAERLMTIQGQRRRESLITDQLNPVTKVPDQFDAEEFEHLNGAMRKVEEVYTTITDLDWQLTKGKHIVEKYKDLVVKM